MSYEEREQWVAFLIHNLYDGRSGGSGVLKPVEYQHFREQNHVFSEDIGSASEDVLWSTLEATEQFDGANVTPNTFRLLGVAPLLGRSITAEDAKAGAPPVFVMSYKLWQGAIAPDTRLLWPSIVLHR